ncbi:MAG: hypothetical protein J6P87_07240 [Lachnospiraceae bacterium]|nr:hypothetical protein [Lachnospiraceae bacterium]
MKFIELKGDTWQKKLTYFKDYYLGWTLLIIGVIILGLYFLYSTVIASKDVILSVVIAAQEPVDTQQMTEELNGVIELGERETADCFQVSSQQNANAAKMAILTRFGAGDIDIFIAEREDLTGYAQTGFMQDLSKWLPPRIYEKLEKEGALMKAQIIEYDQVSFEELSRGEELPYAIEMKALPGLAEYVSGMKDPVLGIAASPDEPDEEIAALLFFMQEDN